MTATNHMGYSVYAMDTRQGWRRASKVQTTWDEAQAMLDAIPADTVERQVRETVLHKGVVT